MTTSESPARCECSGPQVLAQGDRSRCGRCGWLVRRFVFVGEKRSERAISMGVRWTDGRLASRTLHDALEAAGVGTANLLFANLFHDGDGWTVNRAAIRRLRQLSSEGVIIVGMGRRVQAGLAALEIEHLALTHPAARGKIRRRDRYHAHVAAVIGAAA